MKRLFCILALVTLISLLNVTAAQGDSLPDSAYISGLSGHAQNYSISCESRSAVDVAAFWGVSISETEFLEALPRADNPDQGFVGSPNDVWGYTPPRGYGVHASPVAETLRDFGMQAEAHRDLSWDDLREEIDAGRPVIVWVIGQMWGGTPVEYDASDGSSVIVAPYEHTMILVGYSLDTVQVVDSYSGQYQTYWLDAFLQSWSVLGNMAVLSWQEVSSQDDSPTPETLADTYTVQRGDHLMALARDFDINWQELALLNSISYPYTIYPGQVLQLPGTGQSQTEPAGSLPTSRDVEFKVHLPLINNNMAATSTHSAEASPVVAGFADAVVVVHSEHLASLTHRIGVDWQLLVKLNGLRPPYIVRPGQVLRIR